jgi:hypothetical protein
MDMDMYDDIPAGGFEERLLAELKAAMVTRVRERRTGVRLSRRALAGIAAAVVAGGTLTGGLVERQLSGVAAAPAVTHASLDAFLNRAAAAAALKSPGVKLTLGPFGDYILRAVQYGPGQPIECQVGLNPLVETGLTSPVYVGPVTCPQQVPGTGNPVPMPANTVAGKPAPGISQLRELTLQSADARTHRYYPDLHSLSTHPEAMRAALYAAAARGPRYWGMTSDDKNAIVFGLIARIVESGGDQWLYAPLYQVLEQVPGVSMIPDTTDIVGRRATSITFTEHGPHGLTNTTGFLLQAGSYAPLGSTQAGYDWHVPGPPRYSNVSIAYLWVMPLIAMKPSGSHSGR